MTQLASDGSENTDRGAQAVRAKCFCSQSCLGMDIITAGEYVCVSAQVA